MLYLKEKLFTNADTLYEKISERIFFHWKDHQIYRYNVLDKRQKQYLSLNKADVPFSFNTVSKLKLEYFNIFLIFLFIMFNVVSIIMIKEIKNDNIK